MATFTLQDVMTDARRLVQDTSSVYRYDDAHVAAMANQALKRACLIRPDLFAYITTMDCVSGSLQSTPADSVRLIEVLQVSGGNNMNEVNRQSLDLMFNMWQTISPGIPTNWCRHQRNPNQFFVYVPALAGTELIIEYAQSPRVYAYSDSIALLPDAYFPAIVDCTVSLLESVDNEHANSGRAKLFMDSFVQLMGASAQARQVLDNEDAGEPPNTSPS